MSLKNNFQNGQHSEKLFHGVVISMTK